MCFVITHMNMRDNYLCMKKHDYQNQEKTCDEQSDIHFKKKKNETCMKEDTLQSMNKYRNIH